MANNTVSRGTFDLKGLAPILFQERKNKNLTIEQVSEKSGVTPVTISKLERGMLEGANFEKVAAVCTALGFALTYHIAELPEG